MTSAIYRIFSKSLLNIYFYFSMYFIRNIIIFFKKFYYTIYTKIPTKNWTANDCYQETNTNITILIDFSLLLLRAMVPLPKGQRSLTVNYFFFITKKTEVGYTALLSNRFRQLKDTADIGGFWHIFVYKKNFFFFFSSQIASEIGIYYIDVSV